MTVNAVNIFKNLVSAFSSKDYEKMTALCADDLVHEDVASGGSFHGVKEYIDFAKRLHSSFPDQKWEIISAFSQGNRIAAETIWSGTFTHSMDPKIPATGKYVSVRGVSIIELRNGKIWRNREYYDWFPFKQLGF